ncbi:MAG TPA: hypothetical protein VLA61_22825 [Ideonella sp.]|uniref:DUF6976 family protein n=1 Tax=Ideonella sp. TaxID=1929293 RepID=UPI002CF544DC|nr:hypothetical protein [Ideonella sp.]HSI51108.1 hypothetical protein [Ideonella sp.]
MSTKTSLQHRLMSLAQATELIRAGRPCCIAADEALLRRLPRGPWIGGTIPYFMAERGTTTREALFVTELPISGSGPRIMRYDRKTLERVCTDGPEHGFTLIVMPAFSSAHEAFAQEAPGYAEMYLRPLVGWVSGVHLDDLGRAKPLVFDGSTGLALEDGAVAMHVPVPADKLVHVDIVNPVSPETGPAIEFTQGGFSAGDCRIDGRSHNLHDWMVERGFNTQLPLVADYCGALVNVCIRKLDPQSRRVEFYAPVFPGTVYRPARPVGNYVSTFATALASHHIPGEQVFSCNCVLNYAYGGLEGQTVSVQGPATFGEIAYQLLNQTLVYLSLVDEGQ